MITLKNENVSKVINVPTNINEVTPEVLKKLSSNIVLPEYYTLVALCWEVSFATIFFNKKNDNKGAKVIPLLAMKNVPEKENDKYNYLEIGKKLILSRSAIEMGVHIHIPNAASMNSIAAWMESVEKAKNPNYKGININTVPSGNFILIEFKVIPISQICGIINNDIIDDDPFLVNE